MDNQNDKTKRAKSSQPAVVVPMEPELKARIAKAAKAQERSQASLFRIAAIEYLERLGL